MVPLKDPEKVEEDIEELPFDPDEPLENRSNDEIYQFLNAIGVTDEIIHASNILSDETDKSFIDVLSFLFDAYDSDKNYCPNCGEEL